MNFDCDGHVWERLSVVKIKDEWIMTARRIDDEPDDDDDLGVREDRREDLEAILNRDVTDAELDAFIDAGTIPSE